MLKIKIHSNGHIDEVSAPKGANLLNVIRNSDHEVFAPCGGNGTCGKCKVLIKDEGSVTSCIYPVERDIEVFLPDQREARILESQNEYTVHVPYNPGDAANLSPFPHGVAVDIGTTTMVFYLVNLVTGTIVETRSMMNPQAQFGGDVVSRINHCAQPNGLKELQEVTLNAINSQLMHFTLLAEISRDEIVKLSIAGNTTMLHLLLAVDPTPMALAPYTAPFTDEKMLKGADLNLNCHSDAEIKVLPSISSYVGADIVAGMASLKPHDDCKNYLFIDVGTNGEMALITPEKSICCATAAGPAFEGANISCGMGAFEGAISKYDASGYHTIAKTKPEGICGSGLIDIIATLLDQGEINSEGYLEEDFELVPAPDSGTCNPVILSPNDVREVQLAKGAIAAGINILMSKVGVSFDDLDALFLAGGFGNYLQIENAVRIGLIPPELKDKVIPVGNSSGTGALLSLKSIAFDQHIEKVLNQMEHLELTMEEDFPMEFAMNMGFY